MVCVCVWGLQTPAKQSFMVAFEPAHNDRRSSFYPAHAREKRKSEAIYNHLTWVFGVSDKNLQLGSLDNTPEQILR